MRSFTGSAKAFAQSRAILCAAFLAGACGAAAAEERAWYLHAGGLSHHSSQTQAPGRTWQERHASLGLERRFERADDFENRMAIGLMQDSRGFWGGYAGTTLMRTWKFGRTAEVALGGGAYAFYRSVTWKGDGDRTIVPALLPTASIGLFDNRLGLNIIYVPRVAAWNRSMPSVIHAQLVYRAF